MPHPQKTPLRLLTPGERRALEAVARAGSERADRVARARAVLAVADGAPFVAAARAGGRASGLAVARLIARFNREGLAAVTPGHGAGRRRAIPRPSRSGSCARSSERPTARGTAPPPGR